MTIPRIPTIIARELGISPSQVEPGTLLCDLHADALHMRATAAAHEEMEREAA